MLTPTAAIVGAGLSKVTAVSALPLSMFCCTQLKIDDADSKVLITAHHRRAFFWSYDWLLCRTRCPRSFQWWSRRANQDR